MKLRSTIALLAFGLALTAAPAQASHRTILFDVQLDFERAPACAAGDQFGLAFDMVSPSGASLGTGQSCVHAVDDRCEPFTPFCRVTSDATFTLDFTGGSVTARMKLREVKPAESSLIQRGKGRITSGTGEFARARGDVEGGGTIEFTELGPVPDVVYAVRLNGTGG